MSILERIKQIIQKNKTAQNQIIIKEISKKLAQKEPAQNNAAVSVENKQTEKSAEIFLIKQKINRVKMLNLKILILKKKQQILETGI